ncbi:MAG: CHAD domain-containing protein, partial [Pseudomonadota bacterium]
MSYSIRLSDRTFSDGIRRIAQLQANKALSEIDDDELSDAETVHQVRKRCKKLRGLLRLIRPVFADYKRENTAIRDAARQLSEIRDASSIIEAFDRVVASLGADFDRDAFDKVREKLIAARDGLDPDETERRLTDMADSLTAFRQRIPDWSLSADGAEGFEAGLEQVYCDGRKALAAFLKHPEPERFHEWRKNVKYHGYHARLLKNIWPAMMQPHATLLSNLGDGLGDHHDLHVFKEHLEDGSLDVSRPDRKRLRALLSARQDLIERNASAVGQRLYAESPGALSARWS